MILVPGVGGRKGVRIDVGVSLLVIVALEASLLGNGRFAVIVLTDVKNVAVSIFPTLRSNPANSL